jgi:hypothetical protein
LYPPETVSRIFKVIKYGVGNIESAHPQEFEVLSSAWQKEVATILECEPGNL